MNWQYTLDNHLQYGWMRRRNGDEARDYVTKIGKCASPPGRPIDEAMRAATKISEHFGAKIVLCMSGGVDSECMALAFLAAKVPFSVVIGRYGPGKLNHFDIVDAISFCQIFSIPFRLVDIDLVEFFESEKHTQYADLYQCRSPQLAVHIHLLSYVHEEMQSVPALAGNPIELGVESMSGQPIIMLPTEPHLCYLRYFRNQNRPGIPFFFCYSPELIYSFWNTRQFRRDYENILTGGAAGLSKKIIYLGKVEKYREGGFAIRPRESNWTGFESAKAFFREYFRKRGLVSPDPVTDEFDFFFRRPLVERWPYPMPSVAAFSSRYFPARIAEAVNRRHHLSPPHIG